VVPYNESEKKLRGYSNPRRDVTRFKIGEQPKRDQNGTDMALAKWKFQNGKLHSPHMDCGK